MTAVLIADDDGDIRELVAFKLAQKGYQVISTADGPAALAAVEAEPPDLAVLDVTMPGMSGLDVCRALRANPDTAGIAVILLTARAQEADVQAGFGSGADDYVLKPFSPRELLSRIEAVLARVRR
jgi:DNA-binding response OmpR family regulator